MPVFSAAFELIQGFDHVEELKAAVAHAIDLLDSGKARVAEPTGDGWHVNQWLKKAVLLSVELSETEREC